MTPRLLLDIRGQQAEIEMEIFLRLERLAIKRTLRSIDKQINDLTFKRKELRIALDEINEEIAR